MSARHRFVVKGGAEGGFTLAEVLVTITLMGILFAIATASWQNAREARRVTAASNQFAADVRLAHTSATNQLAEWRLNYKADGSPFSCGSLTNADYCLVKLGPGAESIPRTLPQGTRIRGTNLSDLTGLLAGNDRALEFNPDGTAEVVGGAFAASVTEPNPTIRVGADPGTRLSRVSVVRATSRVQVVE